MYASEQLFIKKRNLNVKTLISPAAVRYKATFERLQSRNQGMFVPFVMLGDPTLAQSARHLIDLVEGGADALEVGIPFSDPIADGPVVTAASVRALQNGANFQRCLELVADLKSHYPELPIGALTYANIVLCSGMDSFYTAAAEAGIDSVLIADVPVLEADPFCDAARHAGVCPVLIAAPNTPSPTLARIAQLGEGYTYYVTRAGVTGSEIVAKFDHEQQIQKLKALGAPPPLFGFGISKPQHVALAMQAGAAGVITGSAVVSRMADSSQEESRISAELRRFVAAMKAQTELCSF